MQLYHYIYKYVSRLSGLPALLSIAICFLMWSLCVHADTNEPGRMMVVIREHQTNQPLIEVVFEKAYDKWRLSRWFYDGVSGIDRSWKPFLIEGGEVISKDDHFFDGKQYYAHYWEKEKGTDENIWRRAFLAEGKEEDAYDDFLPPFFRPWLLDRVDAVHTNGHVRVAWRGEDKGEMTEFTVLLDATNGLCLSEEIVRGGQLVYLLTTDTNYFPDESRFRIDESLLRGADIKSRPYFEPVETNVSDVQNSLPGGTAKVLLGLSGIGAVLVPDKTTNHVAIAEVLPGSPAAEKGICVGDELYAVDGIPVKGQSMAQIARMVRGAPGSTVTIAVVRSGITSQVQVTRAAIRFPRVSVGSHSDVGK